MSPIAAAMTEAEPETQRMLPKKSVGLGALWDVLGLPAASTSTKQPKGHLRRSAARIRPASQVTGPPGPFRDICPRSQERCVQRHLPSTLRNFLRAAIRKDLNSLQSRSAADSAFMAL